MDWSKLAQELEVGDSLEDINNHDVDDEHSPLAKIISEVRKYSGNFNVTFSRNLLSNDRDVSAERRGIAPNFIHSSRRLPHEIIRYCYGKEWCD